MRDPGEGKQERGKDDRVVESEAEDDDFGEKDRCEREEDDGYGVEKERDGGVGER